MRVWSAMKTDVVLQARNQLYPISAAVSLLAGGALAWLSPPDQLGATVPMTLLLFAGGSTLLYVVAMILLEKDDGTLSAVCVSPLRPWEYLMAKTLTLTAIAVAEGLAMTLGALWLLSRDAAVSAPAPLPFALGLIALGAMHVLAGVVLVVRYERIVEAIIPMGLLGALFQLPALYVVGALRHPLLLAIPTAAPTLLIQGAFEPLAPWQWAYGVVVTALTLAALGVWARRAFVAHVVRRVG